MSDQKQRIRMLVTVALALVLTACRGPDEAPGTPTIAAEPLAELEGTEWLLTSLYGNRPVEGSSITLGFFPDNYLEGDAGCNSYGGHYATSGSTFDLPKLHRTSLDCDVPDSVVQQDEAYLAALESITAYRATAERLELDDAAGEAILVFARKLPPVVDPVLGDTEWTLAFLLGKGLLEGSHITLNLGQEGFDGFAGCNRYGGEYEAANKGVLITASVWHTEMECESAALTDQEQTYVETLRNSAAYRVTDDRLEIDNAAGETTLVFVRKEEFAMNPNDLLGTDWQLALLNGDSLVEGSTITLAFHNGYQAGGHAGCRDYVATYEANSNDLRFPFFAMIEAGCSGEETLMEQEGKYTSILGWASGYRLQEGQLEILTERGEVLAFEPLPAGAASSLEGTAWMLTAFIEEVNVEGMATPLPRLAEPLPETRITALFESGRVSGSAGCNSYGAAFAADNAALHVETPEATAMGCVDPPGILEQEQRYLEILRSVVAYHIHYNQLWLETGDGRALVFAVEARGYGMTDLVADLRAAGLAVEVTQEMVDHGFAIRGQRLLVNGVPVFAYEFTDATAADLAFAGVSVDEYSITIARSEGEVTVETHGDWIETPHLYKRGRLIVITGDAKEIFGALDTVMGSQVLSPKQRDCSIANAFPPEEAQLTWPTLRQVQPAQAAPGDEVEIRGTGGFLYWNNECGEFRNESARDFQLFFDGEPVGSITCYAYTCLVDLTIPADAAPGIHTVSVEGGSSIDVEVGGEPPLPRSDEVQDLELVGYLGSGQAQAIAVQGHYAYVGIDIELAVVDVSDPSHPQRVGHLFLPGPIVDIALVKDAAQGHTYAYVAAGSGAGLYVVEMADPTKPAVRDNYYSGSYVSEIVVGGGYAYVSGNVLHILDVTHPAAPVEVGTHTLTQRTTGERVAAVVTGDPEGRTYAYTAYEDYTGIYGFRIVDVTAPAAPVALGRLVMNGPIDEVAVANETAYLLVGPGVGRLVTVDVSDLRKPKEVHSALAGSWGGESLAVQDHYLYLAGYDLSESEPAGGLQVLDIEDPANPVALGRYEGMALSIRDASVEGERAYIAAGDGLAVLDVSDPTKPTGTGTYRANALTGSGHDLAVDGSILYIAAGEAGLQVVDASDPVNPRVVGSHDTAGDTWAIALVESDLQGHTYAYLADEYNGLRVIDVSDPLAPVEVGAYDPPEQYEFFHGVAIEGDYAYVADGGLMDTGLRVLDVSDPTRPLEIAFLALTAGREDTPPPRVEDVAVADSIVYLAAGTTGLRVIDVANPAAPAEIGFYDTPGRVDNLTVAGSYAYIVDGDLRILDVSNPAAPAEVGFYDVPDLATIPHVAVQGHRAYLTGDGLRILDISSPGTVLEVTRHPIPLGSVAVASDAVYVIGYGLFVLQTFPPAY